MAEEFIPFDPAEALDSKEVIGIFLAKALESGDDNYIALARSIAARAKKIHHLTEPIELPPETLRKATQAS
ncbi:DNA-binding protein [Duganella sp. BuS-21]|uniref:helix-turn-helix domain-containing transcriptional regulator n=1 Tax=Duganella sp. BuS-21 TaxID=2943848 RepID=UPI0035A60263